MAATPEPEVDLERIRARLDHAQHSMDRALYAARQQGCSEREIARRSGFARGVVRRRLTALEASGEDLGEQTFEVEEEDLRALGKRAFDVSKQARVALGILVRAAEDASREGSDQVRLNKHQTLSTAGYLAEYAEVTNQLWEELLRRQG